MSEKPIIFSGPMVRAILEGRKHMARRVVKPQPVLVYPDENPFHRIYEWKGGRFAHAPYQVGDVLWVRETWADTNGECGPMVSYRAGGDKFLMDDPDLLCTDGSIDYGKLGKCQFTMWCGDLRRGEPEHSWRSSLFMPRWASRINLVVTSVKVERLQDISEEDCIAEGINVDWTWPENVDTDGEYYSAQEREARTIEAFEELWDSINGKKSPWSKNDWVWVVEFEVKE